MNYVITGGTDGIGKAIAKEILSYSNCAEDKLIINYGHSEKKAQDFLESLSELDRSKVSFVKADLSCESGLDEFLEKVYANCNMVDRVICNVGVSEYAKFEDYTMDMWNRVITTNLTIPTFLLKKIRPHIRNGGSVLLIGSYAGIRAYSSSVVYGVSKAGVVFLAKTLVKEFEPQGIRINAVAPGFIETSWQANRSEESYERINKKIALHRFGTPEEVARMGYELLDNDYMNGAVVEIHGGYEYF